MSESFPADAGNVRRLSASSIRFFEENLIMTNYEYVTSKMTETDLAHLMFPHAMDVRDRGETFFDRVRDAWRKWALSASPNEGNMAKGLHEKYEIKDDPSIWYWEKWKYPDGEWRTAGRNSVVSFSVWLSLQYDEKDWVEKDG